MCVYQDSSVMEFYGENIEYSNQHPSFPNIFSPGEGMTVLGRYDRKNRYWNRDFLGTVTTTSTEKMSRERTRPEPEGLAQKASGRDAVLAGTCVDHRWLREICNSIACRRRSANLLRQYLTFSNCPETPCGIASEAIANICGVDDVLEEDALRGVVPRIRDSRFQATPSRRISESLN